MSQSHRDPAGPVTTFLSAGEPRLAAIWRGVMRAECPESVRGLFRDLLAPWGEQPVPRAPAWASDVGDDHTPFEFSLAVGGAEPEVRILVEAQGAEPTPASYWDAGRALSERLAQKYGADLTPLRKVEDLFAPESPDDPFAIWHAVCLFRDRAPEWKVYLNPQSRGRGRAGAVVEEALVRLGYPRAWPLLARVAGQRGPDADELKFFSLDLSPRRDARVKVYFRHHGVTAAELERAFSCTRGYEAGDATAFCRAMLQSEGPFVAKPVGSCFAFAGDDREAPSAATLHLPVAHYVRDDAAVRARVLDYMRARGMDPEAYDAPLAAFAQRPLEAGSGLHSYTSLRLGPRAPRLTFYLSPEMYRAEPPIAQLPPRAPALPPAEQIVRYYERNSMADHPLFQRLAREPVDLHRVWVLLANAQIAIVSDFSRRLAGVTARVTDERLRSMLAKQLNDELGNGDYTRAHRRLFEALLANLEPWRPAGVDDAWLAPGRALSAQLEAICLDPDGYAGVGASMVMEIYGKQVDLQVGRELRRQKRVAPDSLAWLTLHEELEVDHANEALEMARLIPTEGPALEAAWRGARGVCAAAWAFFTDVYRRCYA